ncbi:MAG: ferredoxin--NADP reductase [Alphaproteobacteria bacterium]|nr:ferredoxin--NADP reductase [Alphaproteobacteria bacterium]
MSNFYSERVLEVQHYTDRLFRFRVTRPQALRFRSGEFVMLGLPDEAKPVMRAYSIASPAWDESLEFFSIKVPGGPLTERLQKIQVGDEVLLRQKTTGTLVNDALLPGKRLFMLSTGTGIAPFVSLMRDPETYEKFEQVIVTHTCRTIGELKYGFDSVAAAHSDPLVGEQAGLRLKHFASTTREASAHIGRITTLIATGEFFTALSIPAFNPEHDRIMMCGSMGMIKDVKDMLEPLGFREGSNAAPGNFVVERAFVG